MKNITVKDYQGREISGDWNEKTYTSKVADNLARIYLNNKEYHVDCAEIEKAGANIAADTQKRHQDKLDEIFSKLSSKDKIYMLQKLFYAYDVQEELSKKDARAKGEIHKAMLKLKLFEN